MKRLCLLLTIVLLTASCGSLPRIEANRGAFSDYPAACRQLFLKGNWQFQHVIEASLPGGRKSSLMGVSIVSAEKGNFRSILMTVEGWVVFDVEYDGAIRVLRALPPFDSESFFQGLIHDLRLIFLMPEGVLTEIGTLPGGAAVCRYLQPDGGVIDLSQNAAGCWLLQEYDQQYKKKCTIDIFFNDDVRFDGQDVPSRLKLAVSGYAGYNLDIHLIEAVSLKDPS